MKKSPTSLLRTIVLAAAAAVSAAAPLAASAWIITGLGTNNPQRVFMMVGNGSAALWQNNATINRVSVTVPGAQVGTGAAQAMTSNSTQSTSPYDGFAVCSPPAQVYVGAAYQRRNAGQPANATLQVTSPANLTNGAGDAIPFTEISWTTSALGGDANPNAIPAGTFSGGTQFLTNVAQGTLRENCHTFSFANTTMRPSGTYDGRVTYTLFVP
jgi:hypothetical protein